MGERRYQDVWVEQCRATRRIREDHGVRSAFDYLVAEKLMTFAEAAATRAEFARELPRFVAEVRRIFSQEEIRNHFTRIEREQRAATEATSDEEIDWDAFDTPAETTASATAARSSG